MTEPLPRISAAVGSTVSLDATFYRNGVAENPFAIRRIDIYVTSAVPENLVASVDLPDPDDSSYPSPLTNTSAGAFTYEFDIPCDFDANKAYIDVWRFIGTEACVGTDLDDESVWQERCLKFWVFAEGYFVDDGLYVPRFAFEPLDFKLRKGEVRSISIGVMPLPLYDSCSSFTAMIPQFRPTISIWTDQGELLVDEAAGKMGLRAGSYRSNPYVLSYLLDTSAFLKGTYIYRCSVGLPTNETRISEDFRLTIY